MALSDKIIVGAGPVTLWQWDISVDRSIFPTGPLAAGRDRFTVTGAEGGHRGALVLSQPERDTIVSAFRHHRTLVETLRAVLPYAESRAEDMLEADGEQDGCDPSPETQQAVAAVDAAKALLASLDSEDRYPNGAPKWSPNGTLLDDKGNRSIFDDVDR